MNTIYNQLKESPFMEKKIILLMLMALFSMFANAQQISYIKADGAWYQVYDESGKKVTTLSKSSIGEVVGWGSDFFVAVVIMHGKCTGLLSVRESRDFLCTASHG